MASMYHWRSERGRDSLPALRPLQGRRDIFVSFFGSASTGMHLVPHAVQALPLVWA